MAGSRQITRPRFSSIRSEGWSQSILGILESGVDILVRWKSAGSPEVNDGFHQKSAAYMANEVGHSRQATDSLASDWPMRPADEQRNHPVCQVTEPLATDQLMTRAADGAITLHLMNSGISGS